MEASTSSSSSKKRVGTGLGFMSKFGCGLSSGVLTAYLFNPWDRALYLSVKVIQCSFE
jgi:hypothetical protein